jgi:hypothetical protein
MNSKTVTCNKIEFKLGVELATTSSLRRQARRSLNTYSVLLPRTSMAVAFRLSPDLRISSVRCGVLRLLISRLEGPVKPGFWSR